METLFKANYSITEVFCKIEWRFNLAWRLHCENLSHSIEFVTSWAIPLKSVEQAMKIFFPSMYDYTRRWTII